MTDPEFKLFTVDEAEHALQQAEPLVRHLQALARDLANTQQHLEDGLVKLSHGNGHALEHIRREVETLDARQRELAEAFEDSLTRLQSLGCLLKDLEMGLLDFYSVRDAQIVFLCWRLGEDRIRCWHEVETGFAGRQPLAA